MRIALEGLERRLAELAAEQQALIEARVVARHETPRPAVAPFNWMLPEISTANELECTFAPFGPARGLGIATITHDLSILERDLGRSTILRALHHEFAVVRHPGSATTGLNECLRRTKHEIVLLVHHDVYLPPAFETQIEYALRVMEQRDPNWGVLGVAGARLGNGALHYHGCIFDGITPRRWGYPWNLPVEVDTLDELLLIVRRSAGLQFDETIPGFHGYGAQICLAARRKGLRCYAVLADCEHHSQSSGWSPDEEYLLTHTYVAQRWSNGPYAAMLGPMPDVLPSPLKERVRERYAAIGVG